MPDDAVKSFLDTFFQVHAARQKMLGLDPETAFRQQELQQHADQFRQEQDLREREYGQRQDYQNLLEKQRQDQLKETSETKFGDYLKGLQGEHAIWQPTPTGSVTQQSILGGPVPSGPQAEPAAAAPPVGPIQPFNPAEPIGGIAPMTGVPPAGMQLPPVQIPKEMQGPSGYNPVPVPGGFADRPELKGLTPYVPTELTLAQQKREAEQAGPEYQPTMGRVKELMGEDAPVKMKMSEQLQLLDAHDKMLDRQQQMLDRQENSAATLQMRQYLADEQRQTRLAIAAMGESKGQPSMADIQYNHKSVLSSPESYFDLKGKDQQAENRKLGEEGLPLPVKPPTAVQSQIQASKQVQDQVQNLLQELKDPAISQWFGAIPGRAILGGLESLGDLPGIPDDVKTKLGRIQKNLTTLNFTTAKESMPGRLIGSLVTMMSKSNARMSEAVPIALGQLRGALDTSRAVQVAARRAIGPGWEKRPEFLSTLPEQLHEASGLSQKVMDAIPANQEITLKSLGGRRFIKMEDPNTVKFDSEGKLLEGARPTKVFEVND